MIEKLILKNIQSHKNTEINFHSGINIITGESDQGKSVIIKAIRWIMENRPIGNSMISDTIKKNGKILKNKQGLVELFIDNKKITRFKGNENGYVFNEKRLKAIGTDVPREILDFLRLSEINLQSQKDFWFLINKGSIDITKYLNKLIGIDIADEIISKQKESLNDRKKKHKFFEEEKRKIEKKLDKLKWTKKAERLLLKYEMFIEKKDRLEEDKLIIKESIERYRKYKKINENNKLNSIKRLFDYYKKLIIQKEENEKNKNLIERQIETFKKHSLFLKKYEKRILELRKNIPRICPLCKSVIGGDYV